MPLEFLDRYSRGTTFLHRLSPGLKIVFVLAIVSTGLMVPVTAWPMHGLLLCVVFAALSLAQIPLAYLWQRLLGFWLVAIMLTVSIPAGQNFRGGWDLAFSILLQSTLGFLAGVWLVNVTPFDQLLFTLQRWHAPRLLVALLAFMYRYAYVIFDELHRMQTARQARSFGRTSWWSSWRANMQMIGMLLIRSLSRAERVYGAMSARGWSGKIHLLPPPDRTLRQTSSRDNNPSST